MDFLVDSNLLLRSADLSSPDNATADAAVCTLILSGHRLHCCPQNLIEFWAVASRPKEAQNGLGMSLSAMTAEIGKIRSLFQLLPDTPNIFAEWEHLVVKHNIQGKQVHDTRLVAVMLTHGISHLLTFNIKHFSRYREIRAIDPARV